ncbi:hypothetical protein BOTBODRAFT_33401 [Botryobasidium botryosum FD-172 SS1]|uniref:Uncharacterized protein n=1 Tax=Botryobasidium botryosum (strain FD-172 SS1) TaxID=930990 RepID=A0A067MP87_BOTB1|nr:hypothetical protein BOTBODRAFT_33401 [Botryobasidium botryosum FD-172 SS1]
MIGFHPRREAVWETVDHQAVSPTPMYYNEDDLDISLVYPHDVRGTYIFDMRSNVYQCRQTLVVAQRQLLREVSKLGCNILLHEGWTITTLRKGKALRIEVRYQGRPARADNPPKTPKPPFLSTL